MIEKQALRNIFAAKLKSELDRQGISVKFLSRATKLDKKIISQYLNGNRELCANELLIICKMLGIDGKTWQA